MAHKDIILKSKKIRPHKTYMEPNFEGSTVLVDDQFDYVDLWLKRHANSDSVIFWQQSRNFYKASLILPRESKALPAYYCIMNATKALLTAKGQPYTSHHGLSGKSENRTTSLSNEICKIKGSGLLPSLGSYFGANIANKEVCLMNVFYNIPFIHRAYTITFRSSLNLFIPIEDAHFVRQTNGHEAWFCAKIIDPRYTKDHFICKQRGWERDITESKDFIIRSKRRFRWIPQGIPKHERIRKLTENHKKVRRDIKYIYGPSKLWYFKRNDKIDKILTWPTAALTYIAMHRLSELTRYDPQRLHKHFSCQHNWLLNEFINLACDNYIDQIASEITGQEFMCPGYRK